MLVRQPHCGKSSPSPSFPCSSRKHQGKLPKHQGLFSLCEPLIHRRRTNMQQLTCNIDLSSFFLLSFLLFCFHWAKTLSFEGESPGGNILKECEKVRKVWKIMKRFCPLVVALWFFPKKTLEKKQAMVKKTKDIPKKKNTKETKHRGKEGQGTSLSHRRWCGGWGAGCFGAWRRWCRRARRGRWTQGGEQRRGQRRLGNQQVGGKTNHAISAGWWGGERTMECALQNNFCGGLREWDWSGRRPSPLREMTGRRQTRGGETYHRWGGGVYAWNRCHLANCHFYPAFFGALEGPCSSVRHFINSECPFQTLSPFGESKFSRDTGQNTPKCCVLCHLGPRSVRHEHVKKKRAH